MTNFEIYSLVLALIVFAILTVLSITCIAYIYKMQVRLIKVGAEDEKITKEYEKNKNKKANAFGKVVNYTFTYLMFVVFVVVFSGSIYINCTQNTYFENVPTYRVVKTSSMEKKNKKNEYLFENNLNDQISAFDLILTYKVPKEEDLKLYDIVVYETDGMLIVHRIVGIEEANEKHPNERWFLLQGDAVDAADRFPVKYEQIQGIYKGNKVPYIGSFILFMQSPAGWLCMLLVAGAVIITPIIEKKIEKAKQARILILFPQDTNETISEETVVTEVIKKANSVFDKFSDKRDTRTFIEKLNDSNKDVKDRYETITETIARIAGARVIEGKKYYTYKSGNLPIARLSIRGKTLNAYLGLNPEEYTDTKYIFTDESSVKAHQNYPMRVKLTSNRQVKWANELIEELCAKSGIALLEKPHEIIVETEETDKKWFEGLGKNRDTRTFLERLESLPLANERYNALLETLLRIDGARVIDSKKAQTYKKGNTPIVKFIIKGKTLNAYLGLNPEEYENSKYIFTDESNVKAHQNYPMRVKLTSSRQAKWTSELIEELCVKSGVALLEKPHEIIVETEETDKKWFEGLGKNRDTRSFIEKLESLPLANERYNAIIDVVSRVNGVRVIDSKKSQTYKVGVVPIVKFIIKGKTLNAYLGLNPEEYTDTKYIFTDESNVKAHQNYGMRVKLTSNRQVKWANELIEELCKKNGLVLSDKPKDKQAWFLGLKKKKSLTFNQKLRKANPEVKDRLKTLENALNEIKGVRVIESKKSRTYKVGVTPIVKFIIKGKTLNAYLGLNPKEYENSKYIFTDVSSVKAHQNYGMRVKLTSSRQVKWALELINDILGGEKL